MFVNMKGKAIKENELAFENITVKSSLNLSRHRKREFHLKRMFSILISSLLQSRCHDVAFISAAISVCVLVAHMSRHQMKYF